LPLAGRQAKACYPLRVFICSLFQYRNAANRRLFGAGHDRVPAETERDQQPNCQRSNSEPPQRGRSEAVKDSSPAARVNSPAKKLKTADFPEHEACGALT